MRFLYFSMVLGCLAQPAFADLADCKALYEAEPRSVAGMKLVQRGGLARQTDAGYSIAYGRRPQAWATVYFYDAGRRSPSEDFVVQEFVFTTQGAADGSANYLANQGASQIGQDGDIAISEKKGPKGRIYYESELSFFASNLPQVNNYVFVARVNKCIVKLRITKTGSKQAAIKMFDRAEREFATRYQR